MPLQSLIAASSTRHVPGRARTWLLAAGLCVGCAGRPPESSRPSPAAEKSTHARVDGTDPAVRAVCDGLPTPEDQRACEVIATGRRFDTVALRLCETAAAEPPAALRCMQSIAERHFTARSLQTCETFEGDDRNECLRVLADRRLAAAQVQTCLAKPRSSAALRCLRRAHDYALDLEMLDAIARASAAHPPRLEPNPEPVGDGPIPDEAIVQARERVRRYNHAEIDGLMKYVRAQVETSFPALTLASVEHDMVFNFAGTAAAHYRMLYCTRQEYLIVFGTPIGAHGFSGRYEVDVHDWTLTGRMWIHRVADYAPTIIDPGSWAQLRADDAKIYAAAPETYMIEYARGRIASAFDFGITAPARNVSRDFYNMKKQIRSCLDGALERDLAQVRRMRYVEHEGRRERLEIRRALRAEGLADRLR
ncbi:MAG: hypothetical protein AB1Z98_31765 [Nannocystaceae bacterium]